MGSLGQHFLYQEDITIVKQLGDSRLKVVNLSACRVSGLEEDKLIEYSKKNTVNTEKLSNNIVRAKTRINELALCNPWSYFVTLTINQEKYNRYDLKVYYRDLSEFLHNFNRRRDADKKVKYILIPELHKDGAWHMHGLFQGLTESDLYINDNGYLGWKAYEQRFGYISLGVVKDKDRVSSYITKYITKEMDKNVKELGCHLYYASKGLQSAEELYRGRAELLCDWDYEHPEGYCKIKTFDLDKDDYTEYLKLL
ncbi:MAG: hypothetical protein IJZ53_06925 [Tyzzerella sp.]|nr:hypothetical protein [Tyzzerella sp.]